jgi:hypothetical protein
MTSRYSRAWSAALGLVALVLCGHPVHAQPIESLGTRALGMAGAFVAVADDATAIYWNPAGLALGPRVSVGIDIQTLERSPGLLTDADRRRSFFVGAAEQSAGLAYYRLSTQAVVPDAEGAGDRNTQGVPLPGLRSLVTDTVGLTLLQSLGAGVALGGTVKYVYGTAAAGTPSGPIEAGDEDAWLDQAAELEGHGRGAFDYDLSAIAKFSMVRLGIVARHMAEPTFTTPDGLEVRQERQVRAGVALQPRAGIVVDVDVDLTRRLTPESEERRRVAIGGEAGLGRYLQFRGGLRFDTEEPDEVVPAAGVSLGLGQRLWLDVQVTLGNSQREQGWGIGGRFVM